MIPWAYEDPDLNQNLIYMQYQLLGRSGLKVSSLCLGTMGFGTENGWGADQPTSRKIFETFSEAGGNFLDTANVYTRGTSEKWVGDFVKGRRDGYVIATKYSLVEDPKDPNGSGNNRKTLMRTVEASLKRLDTGFIDLLYLHIWDDLTPVDEVLRGLDDLVSQGKVLYLGISDTPAWVISKANTLAELMGWSRFITLQVEYSLLQRSPERELIPMARHFGMTLVPWAPLAGGALTGKYLLGGSGRIKPESIRRSPRAEQLTRTIMEIARELGVRPASVALQWTRQQGIPCVPITGATRPEQISENLEFLQVFLNADQLLRLDQANPLDLGFPQAFFREEGVRRNLYGAFDAQIQHRPFPA